MSAGDHRDARAAAIYLEERSVDERRLVTREEHGGIGDGLRPTVRAGGRPAHHHVAGLGFRRRIAEIVRALHCSATPLDGIEAALLRAAAQDGNDGCLGVSAVCEFGRADREVARATDASSRLLQVAFEQRLAEAKAAGQVDSKLDAGEAARFLATVLSGMKVSARGGASQKALRAVAQLALRGLRA